MGKPTLRTGDLLSFSKPYQSVTHQNPKSDKFALMMATMAYSQIHQQYLTMTMLKNGGFMMGNCITAVSMQWIILICG
jgi:hypothetical protein